LNSYAASPNAPFIARTAASGGRPGDDKNRGLHLLLALQPLHHLGKRGWGVVESSASLVTRGGKG